MSNIPADPDSADPLKLEIVADGVVPAAAMASSCLENLRAGPGQRACLATQALAPTDALQACLPWLDAMSHPAWLADAQGEVRVVNAHLLALVDCSASDLHGTGWLQNLHIDDVASTIAQWRASVASGLYFLAQIRLRLGDGGYRWHHASAKRFLLADNSPAWLATFTDVHELVTARDDKQASQRRFEATLAYAPVGVAYTSPTGQFTYVNAEFCRLVGYTDGELRQRTWQSITHPDDLEADLALGRQLLASDGRETHYLMDKRYIRKDGQPIHIRLFGNFVRDANGGVIEGLAVILDLSDRRRAEFKEAESTRRRDEFLAMLAHELRNPLGPIRNGAALLRRYPHSAQVAERAGQIIERQTAHLSALLDSLLDVARITRGRIALSRRDCDLVDIADQVLQDHHEEATRRHLVLTRKPGADRLPLHADPVRVAQAVSNLLDNALRFTNAGAISITCWRDDAEGMAVCSITDTGRGMDESTQARLFEPFAQAQQGIDRGMGGLGVGLMIVKAIVELHGGRASGFSEGAGLGSTFELRWPLAAQSS